MTTLDRVKLLSFGITLGTSILILAFGITVRNQIPDTPLSIAGTPLTTIFMICLGIWISFAVVLLVICVYHAFSRPDIALLHLISVLAVLGFFASYVQLDPEMIQVWGPLAVNLGIALSTGAQAAYKRADGTAFRNFVDSFLPQTRNNADDFDNIPLNNLHARPYAPYNV